MVDYVVTSKPEDAVSKRDLKTAMLKGWKQRCPACEKGPLYRQYLKVVDTCPSCGEELHHQRADDAPPYFTMVVVSHVVVAGVLILEKNFAPPGWVHMVLWLPLTVILSLILLPRVKGVLVGVQRALRMHGFGGEPDEPVPHPNPQQ